ncbi:uncharacterized protein BT62DRAFT_170597 [Guyanagaster necrorhizus]|uniref:Uncharacterized protein n=1 Tax=Guyanagaster necrorhizus TaxID=856835 RepID=A0A9P7VT76_9AGAR|nr:uncharacterized protein BT62DRAFT_170597 [Guyanagaster necrorhizus MCA 3950]KAG7445649.1 hypothetical protein BT62DRAFT_170597 [Guyanagaster necrorhizus MCA 3950]
MFADMLCVSLCYDGNCLTIEKKLICRYFGEDISSDADKDYCHSMCDVCKYPRETRQRKYKLTPHEDAGRIANEWQKRNSRTSSSDDVSASNTAWKRPNSFSGTSNFEPKAKKPKSQIYASMLTLLQC